MEEEKELDKKLEKRECQYDNGYNQTPHRFIDHNKIGSECQNNRKKKSKYV
jgi:hypothetical protein